MNWTNTRKYTNQEDLSDAITSSLRVTVKYHLGSIAIGSVLMTLLFIPRLFLQFLTMFSALKEKADGGLRRLDGFFTNNTYIMTAIHGTAFSHSGEKAARLLEQSVGNARDLNSFANYIIHMGKSIVIILSTFFTYMMLTKNVRISYTLYTYSLHLAYFEILFACLCANTILGSLKISVNTLFLRASEELLRNKEDEMPYSMITKEFFDGSYKLFLQTFQNSPISDKSQKYSNIKVFVLIFSCISCIIVSVTLFV